MRRKVVMVFAFFFLSLGLEFVSARNVRDCYQTCLDYCIIGHGDNENEMNICMDGCLFGCEL